MSTTRTLQVILMPAVVEATALHDGTSSPGFPPKLEGFVVQAHGGETHFGGADVEDEDSGFTVRLGESVNIVGFLSRGSPFAYDLTQLYYIGGPWKLVIERQV